MNSFRIILYSMLIIMFVVYNYMLQLISSPTMFTIVLLMYSLGLYASGKMSQGKANTAQYEFLEEKMLDLQNDLATMENQPAQEGAHNG